MCVCVCVCERERERECVCVCVQACIYILDRRKAYVIVSHSQRAQKQYKNIFQGRNGLKINTKADKRKIT